MSIVTDDAQEAVVELLLGDGIFEGAVGDSIEQWEIRGCVFFCCRFPKDAIVSV